MACGMTKHCCPPPFFPYYCIISYSPPCIYLPIYIHTELFSQGQAIIVIIIVAGVIVGVAVVVQEKEEKEKTKKKKNQKG